MRPLPYIDHPDHVSYAMLVKTAGLDALLERDRRTAAAVAAAIAGLSRGETQAAGFRASYPFDDPNNAPDLWIREAQPEVWIKRDDHAEFEPRDGLCGWCGHPHRGGVVAVFTAMLPEEY